MKRNGGDCLENLVLLQFRSFPFSKTGGLADMALFLPKSLKSLGHEVPTVITPYYKNIENIIKMTHKGTKTISMGGIEKPIVHYYFELIYQEMSFIFVQNMHLL